MIIGCLSIMITVTILGNILVVLSVLLVKKLRHPSSNYLLVSLAISDLCVATLVMPLALYNEISMRQAKPGWNLGSATCNMWISFDITCCTASILNLCVISVDRYLSITRPLTYGVSATTRRTLSMIAAIWVASCLISVPPLLVFGNEHGTLNQPRCVVSSNIVYQLYATLGAFYIPLAVMMVMYYKIYIAAKRVVDAEMRAQPARKAQPLVQRSKSRCSTRSLALVNRDRDCNRNQDRDHDHQSEEPHTHTDTGDSGHQVRKNGKATTAESNGASRTGLLDEEHRLRYDSHSDTLPLPLPSSSSRNSSALRERKASITLGVIMTAFSVCWLPFFILALIRPFSNILALESAWLDSFTLWLGYANSMLNPIIYVTFHQDFRKAFKYLLCFKCSSLGARLREEAYQSQFGSSHMSQGAQAVRRRTKDSDSNGLSSTATAHANPARHCTLSPKRPSTELHSFDPITQIPGKEVKV